MFYSGMVIHCQNAEQWNELLRMLEDSGYLWCTGREVFEETSPYNRSQSSFICISDGTHESWPARSFFRRGSSTINDGDMELYSPPIEFEDLLSPVSVDIDDLL